MSKKRNTKAITAALVGSMILTNTAAPILAEEPEQDPVSEDVTDAKVTTTDVESAWQGVLDAREELDNSYQQLQEAVNSMETAQADSAAAEENANAAAETAAAAADTVATVEVQVTEIENTISAAEEERPSAEADVNAAQEAEEEARVNAEAAQEALEADSAAYREAEAALQEAEAEKESADAEVEAKTEANAEAETAAADAETAKTETEEEIRAAEAEKEETRVALEEANTAVDTARAEYEAASQEFVDAKADADEKAELYEDAKTDYNAARENYDSIAASVEEAEAELSQTQGELTDAENRLETAVSELESAEAELAKLQKEYDAITARNEAISTNLKEKLKAAEDAYKAALAKKTQAADALNTAQGKAEETQAALNEANAGVQEAQNAVAAAQSAYEAAETVYENANAAYEEARDRVSEEESAYSEAMQDLSEANSAYDAAHDEAQTIIDDAAAAMQNADSRAEELRILMEAAKELADQSDVTTIKESDIIQRLIDLGYISAEEFHDGMNLAEYADFIASKYDYSRVWNGKQDSNGYRNTGNMLANLKDAIQVIKRTNEIRKACGRSELLVDLYGMVIAMDRAAYSMDYIQQNYQLKHMGSNDPVFGGLTGLNGWNENLAAGYEDPTDGWFVEEGSNYARYIVYCNGSPDSVDWKPGVTSAQIDAMVERLRAAVADGHTQENSSLDTALLCEMTSMIDSLKVVNIGKRIGAIGHYENMIRPDATAIAAGVHGVKLENLTSGKYTNGVDYQQISLELFEKIVADYEDVCRQAYDNYTAAKEKYEEARTALEEKQAAVADLMAKGIVFENGTYVITDEYLSNEKADIEAAEKMAAAALSELTEAQQDLASASVTLTDTKDTMADAKSVLDSAAGALSAVETNADQLSTELDTALNVLADAEAALAEAETDASARRDELNQLMEGSIVDTTDLAAEIAEHEAGIEAQKLDISEAESLIGELTSRYNTLQETYTALLAQETSAKEELDGSSAAVEAALSDYNAAAEYLASVEETVKLADSAVAAALNEQETASGRYAEASEAVTSLSAALEEKENALSAALSSLDESQRELLESLGLQEAAQAAYDTAAERVDGLQPGMDELQAAADAANAAYAAAQALTQEQLERLANCSDEHLAELAEALLQAKRDLENAVTAQTTAQEALAAAMQKAAEASSISSEMRALLETRKQEAASAESRYQEALNLYQVLAAMEDAGGGSQSDNQGGSQSDNQGGTQSDNQGGTQSDSQGGTQSDNQGGTQGSTQTQGGTQYNPGTVSTSTATPVVGGLSGTREGIRVTWKKEDPSAVYRVFYREKGAAKWTIVADTTEDSYVVTGLTSGKEYSFTIRRLNGKGGYSGSIARSKHMRYVAAPEVQTLDMTRTGITVKWNAVTGASKYRVFYREHGTSRWLQVGDTASTSYTIDSLASGKNYDFAVRCVNEEGTSNLSAVGENKTKWFVKAPVVYDLKKTADGVKVSWKAPRGASAYRVFYREAGSNRWIKAGETTSTDYTVKGLKAGKTYVFAARSLDQKTNTYTSVISRINNSIEL